MIKVWKGIKGILIAKTNKPHLNCLKIRENHINDSKIIAKHFNKYFATTCRKNLIEPNKQKLMAVFQT